VYGIRVVMANCVCLIYIIGRLVRCMSMHELRYGFLTTYNVTVFVRRVDDFYFEVTTPVLHDAQEPSLREMFLYFASRLAAPRFKFQAKITTDILVSSES